MLMKIFVTSHLWDKWIFEPLEDGTSSLQIDEPKHIMVYTGLKKTYRNKSIVSVIVKRSDGHEMTILLNPELEMSGSL